MEEYMKITNAYSFPLPEHQDSLQVVKSHGQSDVTTGSVADRWAFKDFVIRVVKTVHKDH